MLFIIRLFEDIRTFNKFRQWLITFNCYRWARAKIRWRMIMNKFNFAIRFIVRDKNTITIKKIIWRICLNDFNTFTITFVTRQYNQFLKFSKWFDCDVLMNWKLNHSLFFLDSKTSIYSNELTFDKTFSLSLHCCI